MIKKSAKYAFPRTLPVMAGYIVLGIGFGILLNKAGYGIWWALMMSGFIYAGSMQFVTVDLITGGASLIATAVMTLMVNARHLFYGISMVDKYKNTGKHKPYLIFALTDETYSLVCDAYIPKEVNKTWVYFFISLFDQIYWICGSLIGSALGNIIPFNTNGIEFSMTALFVVIFVDQWRNTKNHLSALIGLVSTVVCLLLFGSTNFLIPSMILITAVLTIFRGKLEGGKADE